MKLKKKKRSHAPNRSEEGAKQSNLREIIQHLCETRFGQIENTLKPIFSREGFFPVLQDNSELGNGKPLSFPKMVIRFKRSCNELKR